MHSIQQNYLNTDWFLEGQENTHYNITWQPLTSHGKPWWFKSTATRQFVHHIAEAENKQISNHHITGHLWRNPSVVVRFSSQKARNVKILSISWLKNDVITEINILMYKSCSTWLNFTADINPDMRWQKISNYDSLWQLSGSTQLINSLDPG